MGMGLESTNVNEPSGSASPTQGDDAIRAFKAEVIASFQKEHALSGEHQIFSGTATQRPAAGKKGRFYVLTESGVEKEIQYDNGSTWETITKNEDIAGVIADLLAHKTASTIDHPDNSVKKQHLADSVLVKRHFGVANDNSAVTELVNGSETTLHTHPESTTQGATGAITFLTSKEPVVDDSDNNGGLEDITSKTSKKVLDGISGVKAVILEAIGRVQLKTSYGYGDDDSGYYSVNPQIRIRKDSSSDWAVLIGGWFRYKQTEQMDGIGFKGIGIFPINSSNKFQYEVTGFNRKREINVIGYI